MYIKTPKRYRGMQRRNVFSCRQILLLFLTFAIVIVGAGIYQLRDVLRPQMMAVVDTVGQQVDTWQSTQFAPTPTATTDPSRTLVDADNNWQAGRISIALEAYRNILNLAPNNVQVYSRLAMGALTRGELTAALNYAEDAVTADPFDPNAWSTRALVFAWDGDRAQSISSAQQALALLPNDARATAFLAYAYFRSNNDSANSVAEDAIALNPNAWEGYWVRGLINENFFPPDIEAARSDFETAYSYASEQNPAMAGVVAAGIARTLSASDTEGAVAVLNNALSIDADNVEVMFQLGDLYYRVLGEYGTAQSTLEDCVRIAPENYDCWFLLGRSQNSLGAQESALESFERAVALDTPYARHYWWAANMEQVLGSCSRATPYIETGYAMVVEGSLPAADEGDITLQDNFDYLIGLCRVPIVPVTTPEPESTEETAEG